MGVSKSLEIVGVSKPSGIAGVSKLSVMTGNHLATLDLPGKKQTADNALNGS